MLASAAIVRLAVARHACASASCRGAAKRTQQVSVATTSAIDIGASHCYWAITGPERAATGMATLSTAGFAEEGKNSSFAAAFGARREIPEPTVPQCAAPRRAASQRACPSTADKRKESTPSFPLSEYRAPGGVRQGPSRAAQSSTEARTYENR